MQHNDRNDSFPIALNHDLTLVPCYLGGIPSTMNERMTFWDADTFAFWLPSFEKDRLGRVGCNLKISFM